MLAEHLRPIRHQVHLAVDEYGRWVDSGVWRERGVTHWHLVRSDWDRSDRERFDTERTRAERLRPTHGVAADPREVADWLINEALAAAKECPSPEAMIKSSGLDTPHGVRLKHEVSFWAAMRGRDVCGLMGLGELRIAHLSAYAMTAGECGVDHR